LLTVALAGPLLVSSVIAGLRDVLSNDNAALALVPVVVIVAAAGDRVSAIVAALSCAAWFDFFLTRPYYTFTINDRDDIETAVLLVLVGLAVTEIALWGRRQQGRASRRHGYLDGVVSAAQMAAEGNTPSSAVLTFVADQILEVLGVDRCEFKPGNPGPHPRINQDGSVTGSSDFRWG
jgi:K+-sensing histidine kinase KdpD